MKWFSSVLWSSWEAFQKQIRNTFKIKTSTFWHLKWHRTSCPIADQLFLEPSLWRWLPVLYHSSFPWVPCTLPRPAEQPDSLHRVHLFTVFLLLSPAISLKERPGLPIFIFSDWRPDSKPSLINACWTNECMSLECLFPSSWSWQFLHEAGPPYTKDTPHSRFDSERIDFWECHYLRDLGFLVICNVQCPLLVLGFQNLPVMTLFSSLVSIQVLITFSLFLLENCEYVWLFSCYLTIGRWRKTSSLFSTF